MGIQLPKDFKTAIVSASTTVGAFVDRKLALPSPEQLAHTVEETVVSIVSEASGISRESVEKGLKATLNVDEVQHGLMHAVEEARHFLQKMGVTPTSSDAPSTAGAKPEGPQKGR